MTEQQKKAVSSSMIELKAELYRKQEEFRSQKGSSTKFVRARKDVKSGKPSIWSRQNKGVSERASKDEATEENEEEEDALIKSRRALEEKAKLYEKMTSSTSEIPEEDGSGYFLVDFQKKAIDAIVSEREEQRRKEEEKEEEDERIALAHPIPEASTPEEEWVDFTDSMGRSRRCMRKDLDQLMKQDRDFALHQLNKGQMDGSKVTSAAQCSVEEYREKMRKKWDREKEELDSKGHGQVHYSNVQYDEIRTHGVGFFQFAKDHESRQEQLDTLKKLREETQDEKSRRDKIKDKRKSMMEARLAKVRERRKLKDTATEDVKKEETSDTALVKTEDSASEEEKKKKEEEQKEAEELRKAHIRDWDKGKKTSVEGLYQNYVDTRRQEREEEFAPPSLYFQQSGPAGRAKSGTAKASFSDKDRINRLQEFTRQGKQQTSSANVGPPKELLADSELISGERSSSDFNVSNVPPPSDRVSKTERNGSNNSQSYSGYGDNGNGSQNFGEASVGNEPAWQNDQYWPNMSSTNQNFQHYQPNRLYQEPSQPNQHQHYQSDFSHYNYQHPPISNNLNKFQSTQWDTYYQQRNQAPSWTATNSTVQAQGTGQMPPPPPPPPPPPCTNTNSMQSQGVGFIPPPPQPHSLITSQPPPPAPPPPLSLTTPPPTTATMTISQNHQQTAVSYNTPKPNSSNINSYTDKKQAKKHKTSRDDNNQINTSKTNFNPEPLKKKAVSKSAIMDMRYMQNDTDPNDSSMATIEAPSSITGAVEYTFGSFMAAKEASHDLYEEHVVESQGKSQISGGARLYTAEEIEEQKRQQEEAEAQNKVHEFLDSLK